MQRLLTSHTRLRQPRGRRSRSFIRHIAFGTILVVIMAIIISLGVLLKKEPVATTATDSITTKQDTFPVTYVPTTAKFTPTVDATQTSQTEQVADSTINQRYTTIQESTPSSCSGISLDSAKSKNLTGGVFDIDVPGIGLQEVYCDVTTDGGNWTVFQRRMDGSVDFNINWVNYTNGFGKASGELWLGLEALHQMTKFGQHELRVDMIEADGVQYYAKYRFFKVGPAWDNYRISMKGYFGNCTDSFSPQNGNQFSTKDEEHDHDEDVGRHCASRFKGGWWYQRCHPSNLNGPYNGVGWNGIVWVKQGTPRRIMNMRFTEMKFRKKN